MALRIASVRPDLVRSWAAGDGPLNAGYVWHPLARVLQTPGEGEAYLRTFDPAEFEAALRADGVPPEPAYAAPRRVDTVMKDCLLKLYRSATTVGADWQPGLARATAPDL